MIGNAFPPPVAKAVGEEIMRVLKNNGIIADSRENEVP